MSKTSIIQRGVIKTVPTAHAKILIALKKATLAPESAPDQKPEESVEESDQKPEKRTYRRKDLTAEAE